MLNEACSPAEQIPSYYGVSILIFLPQPSLERDTLLYTQGFFVGEDEKRKIAPSVKTLFQGQKRLKNVILDMSHAVRCVAAAATSDARYYCSIHITFFKPSPTSGGARVGGNTPTRSIVPTLQQRHWLG